MADFSRRDFLKAVSLAGTAAAFGCSSDSPRKLIPYLIPPEDLIPGEATWYATTCRECPAGCGLLAKNRDGRVIKVEGNPDHPVNRGKVCARGQAAAEGVYNPDRYPGPLQGDGQGNFKPLDWSAAEKILVEKLSRMQERGLGKRIVFLSDLMTGALPDLLGGWLQSLGAPEALFYEPLAYEPLRQANQWVFGLDGIPAYRLDQADFLLSFGADFLEAWISNVQYARQFATFRAPRIEGKNVFAYIGPRLSLTAANADSWIPVSPENISLVAWGFLRLLLEKNLPFSFSPAQREALRAKAADITPEVIETRAGISKSRMHSLVLKFVQAKRPLVLSSGLSFTDPQATETAVAANLLCTLLPGTREALDLDDPSALGKSARAEKIKEVAEKMLRGEVDLLLLYQANPLFTLPPAWDLKKALQTVPFVVSFSSFRDETGQFARLILPTNTFLESWGDFSPRRTVRGLMQPVMGPLLNTRQLGDILLSTGKRLRGEEKFPAKTFYEFLRRFWDREERIKRGESGEAFWETSLRKGGFFEERKGNVSRPLISRAADFSFPRVSLQTSAPEGKSFYFIAYPTVQFFDGRSANRPFLQELPDPMTQITWGGWVEINPETASKLGIKKDELITLKSSHGTWQAPVYPYLGIPPGVLAMPLGQGHSAFGQFAGSQADNPVRGISSHLDPSSGGIVWATSGVTVQKAGRSLALANTDGSLYQHGRRLAQSIAWEEYRRSAGKKPSLALPLPQGFTERDDFYHPHPHPEYRWVMIVDLDRCIGCGACVVACYAENNVAVVGREQVLFGREMAWLHIERYFEEERPLLDQPARVQFLPMLCQHCDAAPCESVCPVFAPHHSHDGINNQVYNRCIGTRFCSQNCPYKARRFNWFTWPRAQSLDWQLNPDVTVRHKGVMEKCSFCIQRIVAAKVQARSEGRQVRDGEFTTACAQTCPAEALIFGNLLDPKSRVAELIRNPRAYQVLAQLNTKPGVIYLKKITQKI